MKCDEEDLKYCYMLLFGAGAIVASSVFCLAKYRDVFSKWVAGFMF